ncbi:hypothetical protein SPAN111604_14970 [Sphingomonas antarctica]|uniref:hypothetical protein n=1 Tax=Sphingomonas antarctica TaxID=2040274 RepID=UPI0039EA75FF
MSESMLVNALRHAVSLVRGPIGDPIRPDWADFDAVAISPFVNALTYAPELQRIWGRWAVTPGSGSTLSADAAARYLISRARAQFSPDVIIADLLRFAASGEVDYQSVRAVTNVEVVESVPVGHNVRLMPPASLPPGVCRNVAFQMGLAVGDDDRIAPGLSALVVSVNMEPLRDAPRPQVVGGVPMPIPILVAPEVQEQLDDAFVRARVALVAAGGAAPKFGASYGYVSSPGWPLLIDNGVGGGAIVPPPPPRLTTAHASALKRVYELAEAPDQTIMLAVDHLAAARMRQSDTERAIDIGSCLEILLMHEQKSDNTEITNKISHRGAWLIGNDGPSRLKAFKTIKEAYNFRSKAIHSGKLPVIKSMEEHEARQSFFRESEDIIGRLIEVLLQGWPKKWDEVTLSAN